MQEGKALSCMQRIQLLWRGHEPQSLTQLLLHARHTLQTSALHGNGRSYTATAAEGPPRDKVTGLPFTVSPAEADETYDGFHSTANRVLTAQPAARVGKKESYLPFWICRAEVCSGSAILEATCILLPLFVLYQSKLPAKLALGTCSRDHASCLCTQELHDRMSPVPCIATAAAQHLRA